MINQIIEKRSLGFRLLEAASYCLEAALRFLYPALCGLCEKSLDLDEKNLCQNCNQSLFDVKLSYYEALSAKSLENVTDIWSAYPYSEPLKRLIPFAKFHKMSWLLDTALNQSSSLLLAMAGESNYDAVIPVPLHRWKRFQREFNQAEKIAGKVSKLFRIPVVNALYKKSMSNPQASLNQKERQFNLIGSFRVRKNIDLQNKRLLLVDDVLTTGATAKECAAVLKAAGASEVSLFTLARTNELS